jgi:cytochrome b561
MRIAALQKGAPMTAVLDSMRRDPAPTSGHAPRYGAISQAFHWLTVLLVGAAFLLGEGGPETRVYSTTRAFDLSLHETLGIAVLTVVVLRLIWRFFDRPPHEPSMPGWMEISSKLAHWGLYALLFAVPLTAIVGAWLEGHPVFLMGWGAIGPLLSQSHALGQTITDIHTFLGDLIIWLAGLHAAAALFHHFVMRDGVLLSMLPGGRQDR